jgi:hypothetical protein
MFKRKNDEKNKNEFESAEVRAYKNRRSPLREAFPEIVYFEALDTHRVIWAAHIEQHNDRYYIHKDSWYSLIKQDQYQISITRVDGKLLANLHHYRIGTTDYALQYPEYWLEVELVYEQELPFDA